MFKTLYGVQKLVGKELVFFYMTEVEKDESFSHEYGTEEVTYMNLDWFLQVDTWEYDNAELVEEYFEEHHTELEKEIKLNYQSGLLISKKVL